MYSVPNPVLVAKLAATLARLRAAAAHGFRTDLPPTAPPESPAQAAARRRAYWEQVRLEECSTAPDCPCEYCEADRREHAADCRRQDRQDPY